MPRRRPAPRRSGYLLIDKPPGWTSHDVVARVRRIVGERAVGHAGTLDPAATGVLPVAVGHATKTLPWLESADKTYVAVVQLGVETDSGDRDGRLVRTAPWRHLTEAEVRDILMRFTGEIEQVPPMTSAVQVDGLRLHEAARRGMAVDIPSRWVVVHELEIAVWHPPRVTVRVRCSKGTYIRSLARDVGAALGTAASLRSLVRVRAGRFHLRDCVTLDDLPSTIERSGWACVALHPTVVLADRSALWLTPDEERLWFTGMPVPRAGLAGDVGVYTDGRIWAGIGTGDPDAGVVRPRRVIGEPS